jgi:hypothetical protein
MTLTLVTELYAQGRYDEALQIALNNVNPAEQAETLLLVSKCFVATGDIAGLGNILSLNEQSGTPPTRTLYLILHNCIEDGLYRQLIAMEKAVPAGNPLFPIILYYASCAQLMLGQDDEALAGFERFRLAVPTFFNSMPLLADNSFNVMFRQATLVLPVQSTAARLAEGAVMPPAQADIELVRPQASDGVSPCIICCADARYVHHFLPRWLGALAGFRHAVHVHIINPDTEILPLVDRLGSELGIARRLSASISTDRLHTATSYACARFEIVPFLLRELGRPVLALDIDVAATASLDALASSPFTGDFGCFETGRRAPASIHQASVMWFAQSAETFTFVADLAAFCRPKLNQVVPANWMLDQAALFSVIRLYRRTHPDFDYQALDRVTGSPMADFVSGLASEAEKQAIKAEVSGLNRNATAHLDLSWVP